MFFQSEQDKNQTFFLMFLAAFSGFHENLHFCVWFLNKICSDIFLKSEYSSTWYCNRLLTVWLFFKNPKLVCKLSYECKRLKLIAEFWFVLGNSCVLIFITSRRLKQKVKSINYQTIWYQLILFCLNHTPV